jgi:hypothetical protein
MILRFPPGAQSTVKNENHFSIAKSTSFYSEFDADSEYVILFKKCFGQKNGLTATCPFNRYLFSGRSNEGKWGRQNDSGYLRNKSGTEIGRVVFCEIKLKNMIRDHLLF